MENKLITEIYIGGKSITHFDSFELQQKFNGHHYFELQFKQQELAIPGFITLDNSRDFIGKTFTAAFGHWPGKLQEFAGVVTKVALAQRHGYHSVLIVSGYSPTILIDRGADLGSYLDKSLDEIVALATKDTPENELKVVVNAKRKSPIDYLIQYKESDFAFLNRLSAQYHEWFFYDGKQLNFGTPDEQKDILLFYGRDLQELEYAMKVAPIKHQAFSYRAETDEMLESESDAESEDHPDLEHAAQAAKSIYSKTYHHATPIRIADANELKNHVADENKARLSELLKISGKGDNAELAIGAVADIMMSMKQESSFVTENLGKFIITSIHHHIDATGHYHHTFEGITATSECIWVKQDQMPNPDMQLADVVDNDDPKGQGRVKVKFKWASANNDISEWLRVISPDAGSSASVNTNRGFVFVPEVGDQVVVAFEDGHISHPIVMGSVFHGLNGSGGYEQNRLKTIATRSGHLIAFDDLAGAETIVITDRNNNLIRFNTQTSSIEISAPEDINLQAKNIHINAVQNVSISAGEHINCNASGNISNNAGKNHQVAAKNIGLTAQEQIEKNAVHIEGMADKFDLDASKKNIELHSNTQIINKGNSNVKLF